jgi:hypothetical protein
MLIVIPVGPADSSNLSLLTQALVSLGSIETQVLIVSVPSTLEACHDAALDLQSIAPVTTVVSTENEFSNGWHIGPDRMFLWTVQYLDRTGNTEPWLWMEPDACPVKPKWDTLLADDYKAQGKPYYGYVRPTKWKTPDGEVSYKDGDDMLLGVAIYPPRMMQDGELVPLLNDLGHADPRVHPPVPWDIYCRWVFFRRGVHSTHLIYDRWRTHNYAHGEFDTLTCEPMEEGAEGGVIPEESVLVHGCKDGSLHRLVIGEKKPLVIQASGSHDAIKIEPEARRYFVEQPSHPRNANFGAVAQLTQEVTAPFFKVVEENFDLSKIKPALPPNHQKLLDAIKHFGNPRIGQVVTQSGLSKETVKEILPLIGYEMVQAGWIKKLPKKKQTA